MTDEKRNWEVKFKVNPALFAYCALTLFIVLAFVGQGLVVRRVNAKDNATRCAVVGLIFDLSANSKRNAEATIASKTTTPAQKAAATTNLAAIATAEIETQDFLGHPTGDRCKAAP